MEEVGELSRCEGRRWLVCDEDGGQGEGEVEVVLEVVAELLTRHVMAAAVEQCVLDGLLGFIFYS